MYADKYARRAKLDPKSMGLAMALNGAILTGLVFSAPNITKIIKKIDDPIHVVDVYLKPPPPPHPVDHPKKDPLPKQASHPDIVKTIVATKVADGPYFTPQPPSPPGPSTGDGIGFEPVKPPPPPVLIDPQVDGRYAGYLQPEYPSQDRRMGTQGRVVVRVLIGVDGRVKEVEKVSAATDSMFEATRRQALGKWRFKPGTRDGVPIEAWRTMSLSFVIHDE